MKNNKARKETVAIIGAGWFGAHIALTLQKKYEVTLIEKNSEIFSGISGQFGVRLHTGPHYPRSQSTREGCHNGYEEFLQTYPELINEHSYSVYCLGTEDAIGLPSKVNKQQFDRVCREFKHIKQIGQNKDGSTIYHNLKYQNIISMHDVDEPSLIVGERLRSIFKSYLDAANIPIKTNFAVKDIKKEHGFMTITAHNSLTGLDEALAFDHVVNATSYKTLLPQKSQLPSFMDVVYQPCLALVYKDLHPTKEPFSFITMDGWFPCLMPYDDRTNISQEFQHYIMTHGMWTIIGSYATQGEAQKCLDMVDDKFIIGKVKINCESEMHRFWPEFKERFEYIDWKGSVLAKIKTDKEFRGTVTFKASNDVIYVFPGKVSNIFEAGREVSALLSGKNVSAAESGKYHFVQHGAIDAYKHEIAEKPKQNHRATCELQTHRNTV